jgi:hypothetical protein
MESGLLSGLAFIVLAIGTILDLKKLQTATHKACDSQ